MERSFDFIVLMVEGLKLWQHRILGLKSMQALKLLALTQRQEGSTCYFSPCFHCTLEFLHTTRFPKVAEASRLRNSFVTSCLCVRSKLL